MANRVFTIMKDFYISLDLRFVFMKLMLEMMQSLVIWLLDKLFGLHFRFEKIEEIIDIYKKKH